MRRLAALLALALAGPALAQCGTCDGAGTRPCPRHDAGLESAVVFCSEVSKCTTCRGAGRLDCGECETDGATLARLRGRTSDLMRAVEPVRDPGLLVVESEHVRVALTAPRWTIDGGRCDTHALAHVCIERLEAVRSEFLETFGLTAADFPSVPTGTQSAGDPTETGATSAVLDFVLLQDGADVRRVAPALTGRTMVGVGILAHAPRATFCGEFDRSRIRDDGDLRRTIAHVGAHLLLANANAGRSPGELGHGWIEAGVAHLFEAHAGDGRCGVLCFGDSVHAIEPTYRAGDWRAAVRELADGERLLAFAALAALQPEALDLEAHAQSFAFVEFLLAQAEGARFMQLVRAIVGGAEPVAATHAAYPDPQESLDERFARWVVENYPPP